MTVGHSAPGLDELGGLYAELPGGKVVRVAAPDDALLFMVGAGGGAWLGALRLRAVPHALVLPWAAPSAAGAAPRPSSGGAWRAWHGRMFLPPADAIVRVGQAAVPFAQLRADQRAELLQRDDGSHATIGCDLGPSPEPPAASDRPWRLDLAGSDDAGCAAHEVSEARGARSAARAFSWEVVPFQNDTP
jgi:hypothetical protein